jgi:hypothetical protein
VVRAEGRVPVDAEDGVTVAGEAGQTVCVDPKAPAAVLVGYAVFASTEDGPWSRPANASLEVLPGVTNVRLTAENGVVDGRWTIHPEVVRVQVHRDDGREIPTSGRTHFRDRTAAEGAEHTYTFVAHYHRADGSTAPSAPVRMRTADTGRLLPLRALSLKAVFDDARPKVALAWKQQPDSDIVIRRAATPCPWEFGEAVSFDDLADYGEEVVGDRAEQDGWCTLTAEVPIGRFHYVPFTIGPGGAVRGHGDGLGVVVPVHGIRHQRFGERLTLAWQWPAEAGIAQVRWRTEHGSGQFEITRQQYQSGGGCHVDVGPGRATVRVRTRAVTEAGDCFSPDIELVVPERAPTVTYSVDMTRRPVVGGGTVRVRLSADQDIAQVVVVVVAAQGAVMPRRPADGTQLLRGQQVLGPNRDVVLTAELPRLRKPYWVRCFVETEGVRLVDPSVSQLKVS